MGINFNIKSNKKSQAGTGIILFVSIIIIVFIFLAFNVLSTINAETTKYEITESNQLFKIDQTLISFVRTRELKTLLQLLMKPDHAMPLATRQKRY